MTSVRAARADDARAIAEVHVASWRWAYRRILTDAFLDGLSVDDRERAWAAWFAGQEPRGCVFVAADPTGAVVGFVNAGPSRDEGASPETGEVRAIYVLPEVQGTGVGRALMEAADAGLRAAGFRRATLWVLEANDLGRRFYEKAGWAWDGATSDHRFDCGNRPIVRYAADLAGDVA